MSPVLRIQRGHVDELRTDLQRPHPFAAERVSFLSCKFARMKGGAIAMLGHRLHPVDDDHYIDDDRYGAVISSAAFRAAMEIALLSDVGLFHVHMHPGSGAPRPSRTDFRETRVFVPDFFNVQPTLLHGALILSEDSMSGRVWSSRKGEPQTIKRIHVVGAPMQTLVNHE